jgi:uncharacterized protein YgiM (DUF1202 family)
LNLAQRLPTAPASMVIGLGLGLALVLAGCAGVRAEGSAATARLSSAIEAIPPTIFVARHDAVPVRAEPGFVYREIGRLEAGDRVEIDAKQDQWLRVRAGGWIFQDHAWTEAEAAAAKPATTRLIVLRDSARIRAAASLDAAVIDTAEADAIVEAVARSDGWWQLASGGFISELLVRPEELTPLSVAAGAASRPDRPLPWVVAADSANVRSGRGTEHPVVRRLSRGDIVTVTSAVEGWAEVDGGWVRQDLLEPPAPPRRAGPSTAGGAPSGPRRWSLMDLNGTVIQVYELTDGEAVAGVRAEMRATGVLEADWTMLGISIGVPADSKYVFNYSPDGNATRVTDVQRQRYGNVYAKGPLERVPAHVRALLDGRSINPGERFDGLLLFRPTLKTRDIAGITFDLAGKSQRLMPSR